jgi:hypothetical protein
MAIDLFKGLFKEVSVLEVLNLFQMSSMKGLLEKVGIGKKGGSSASSDSTAVAEDGGKGNVDEHNALIAMAETHFGKSLSDMTEEEYAVSRRRFSKLMAIHKALREQGKSGGAEKLMHIIGHESHLHGTVATPKVTRGQKPEDQPQRIDIHNVRERTNPAGRLIVRFLTDLETQEAVDLLVAASITDTGKDKTAAAARATQDKLAKVWGNLREWYGAHDTDIHVSTARYLLKDFKIGEGSDARPAIDVLLESDEALEWIRKIDAAEQNPDEKRKLQEGMQRWLQEKVFLIRKCKGALRDQERRQNTDGRTDEERSQRRWRYVYIAGGIAFVVVIVIGSIQGALR